MVNKHVSDLVDSMTLACCCLLDDPHFFTLLYISSFLCMVIYLFIDNKGKLSRAEPVVGTLKLQEVLTRFTRSYPDI